MLHAGQALSAVFTPTKHAAVSGLLQDNISVQEIVGALNSSPVLLLAGPVHMTECWTLIGGEIRMMEWWRRKVGVRDSHCPALPD